MGDPARQGIPPGTDVPRPGASESRFNSVQQRLWNAYRDGVDTFAAGDLDGYGTATDDMLDLILSLPFLRDELEGVK